MTHFKLHRFQVNKQVAAFLQKRQPWIYRRQCSSALEALPVGALVRIVGPQNEFLAIGIYEPLSIAAIRVFSWDDVEMDGRYFRERLLQLWQTRSHRAKHQGTNAFRWIHGEADGFPGLNVDVYDKIAVGVPYLEAWPPLLISIWREMAPDLGLELFFLKPPHGKSADTLFEVLTGRQQQVCEPFWFLEGKQKFPVFPLTGQKTGFYLDLREVRRVLSTLDLRGKRVLNLFANTGVLSGLCEKQGASDIVSVEASARCQSQFLQLAAVWNLTAKRHHWFGEDVWTFLDSDFLKGVPPFDVIILDPPSLAKSRAKAASLGAVWSGLVKKCLMHLEMGGHLLTVSCTERLPVSEHKIATQDAARKMNMSLDFVGELPRPFDHPICPGLQERDYFHALQWIRRT